MGKLRTVRVLHCASTRLETRPFLMKMLQRSVGILSFAQKVYGLGLL